MINPIEQKLQRYWDRIQRALQVLQGLDDVTVMMDDCEAAITYARAVDHAVAILQEGQQ